MYNKKTIVNTIVLQGIPWWSSGQDSVYLNSIPGQENKTPQAVKHSKKKKKKKITVYFKFAKSGF